MCPGNMYGACTNVSKVSNLTEKIFTMISERNDVNINNKKFKKC